MAPFIPGGARITMVEDEAPEEGRDVAVSANDPNKILFAQLCDLFEAIRGVNDSGR